MKHLKFNTFLLTLLLSMAGITAAAHDIEVANNGKTIYYVWTGNGAELAVSYGGNSYSSYSYEYSGNVVIPESVTYNGVTYPVTSIYSEAFRGCSGLTDVTIGNSVTSIGDRAFLGCSGLTSLTIPNSVTNIFDYAFDGCSGLTSVTIPNSVTSIGGSAFWGCSGLTSVTIGNSVTSIGEFAFSGCSGLTSVTIPNSVTSIGYAAFYGSSGLESMTVASGNSTYDSRANCNAIIETASNTLIAGCKNTIIPNSVTSIGRSAFDGCSGLTSVTIPNSVTSIGDYAFSECSGLTSVTIPNSVTSIGNSAFSRCSGLTSVTIPNSVTSIGYYAFLACSGLTSVTIPSSVTSIGSDAFYNCTGLTSVTIGNSVTSIGNSAFAYCSGLTDVFCYAENVPTTDAFIFSGSKISSATLHVPAASLSSYQTTGPWSGFGQIVALPEKCATPTIAFTNGILTFECETEGVEFVNTITASVDESPTGNNVPLPELKTTYHVSVYAVKEGYVNSDVATMDIDFQPKTGDVNGDGEVTIADAVAVVDIILNSPSAAP